jgi:hypothetical protein
LGRINSQIFSCLERLLDKTIGAIGIFVARTIASQFSIATWFDAAEWIRDNFKKSQKLQE